jgi:hypothetical protein
MKLLTDRELNQIIQELELPTNSRNYLDFTKQGKWNARLLLLTAMFHEDEGISVTELVYNAFSQEQSIAKTFNILRKPVRSNLKIESERIQLVN